jgi:NAD(P)-dependent dehydrogenase (short-subunit alcohol dehydrogenase family)
MHVIVTGANRGIGLELVKQLLARGDHVEATCRRPREAAALRATDSHVHAVDITDGDSVAAFAHSLAGEPIDLVINNAGVSGGPRQRLQGFDYEAATRTFETNALGALRVSQAFVPHLRHGIGKKLVHLSSTMGSIGATTSPGDLAYRMSKAALHMMSKSIAAELHGDHIISIVVHAGWARTQIGGPNAPMSAAESARGILRQVDAVQFIDSGGFVDFKGEPCVW